MRRRLALFVPALALAAAGSLPLTGVLSGSAGASSSRNTGGSVTAGQEKSKAETRTDDHVKRDGDKGEHLDLTCWDRDRPMNTTSSSATPPSTTTATTSDQGAIQCNWNPATR